MTLNERIFFQDLKQHGIEEPVKEYKFHPNRKFRADYAFLERKIILEIEGGIWLRGGGRHNRGSGFLKDLSKYNEAAILGWRVLRITPQQLSTAAELIMRAIITK